jgi:hypothetical protein
MNGKKAKLLRKYGKLDNRVKKQYNSLNHEEKGLLSDIYQFSLQRKQLSTEEPKKD